MASIKISTLDHAGLDLFADAESYMGSLSNEEMKQIQGGATPASPVLAAWYVGGAVLGFVGAIGVGVALSKQK